MQKISVVIPAYNEASGITNTLQTLQNIDLIHEIIVVDDGSTDRTGDMVQAFPHIKLITHKKNRGKAAALATGTAEALIQGEIIAYLDADLGESSREVEKLIFPVINQEAQVTIAKFPVSRGKGGFGLVKGLVYWGQQLHTGQSIDSALSGQRVMTKDIIQTIQFPQYGYGIELAMTIDLLKAGVCLLEVPVNMTHHETGRDLSGFIHRGKQFVHILGTLLHKKFH